MIMNSRGYLVSVIIITTRFTVESREYGVPRPAGRDILRLGKYRCKSVGWETSASDGCTSPPTGQKLLDQVSSDHSWNVGPQSGNSGQSQNNNQLSGRVIRKSKWSAPSK